MIGRRMILVLNDEEFVIQGLGKLFQRIGYAVIACLPPEEALDRINKTEIDLVIAELRMPTMNGVDFLNRVRAGRPGAVRVLLTNPDERKLASAAIARGIADWFIEKPWDEQLIKITLPMVMRIRPMAEAFRQLKEMVRKTHGENEKTAVLHNDLVSHGFEL